MGNENAPAPAPISARAGRTRTLRLLVVIVVAVQGLVLAGFGVAWLVTLLRGAAERPGAVAVLAALGLLGGVVLVLLARNVWRASAASRAPLITWEILLGIMAVEWTSSGAPALGVAALVSALAVVVALLVPGVVERRRALVED